MVKDITKISKVCKHCGISANVLTCLKKYGEAPKHLAYIVSTFHTSICDICGHKRPVTEPRDFFYPNFALLLKAMQRPTTKKVSRVKARRNTTVYCGNEPIPPLSLESLEAVMKNNPHPKKGEVMKVLRHP